MPLTHVVTVDKTARSHVPHMDALHTRSLDLPCLKHD